MKRLIIRNGLSHTQTDHNEKREQLINEFNEIKQLHEHRLQEISNNEEMSTKDKIMELQYEKAILLEEYDNYSQAINEYSTSDNDYEGYLRDAESELYLAEDYAFGQSVEVNDETELTVAYDEDVEPSY